MRDVTITGITRPLDNLGRVVIPKELRDVLDWTAKERIEILTTNFDGEDVVMLRKFPNRCALCGQKKDLRKLPVSEKQICSACAAKIMHVFSVMNAE